MRDRSLLVRCTRRNWKGGRYLRPIPGHRYALLTSQIRRGSLTSPPASNIVAKDIFPVTKTLSPVKVMCNSTAVGYSSIFSFSVADELFLDFDRRGFQMLERPLYPNEGWMVGPATWDSKLALLYLNGLHTNDCTSHIRALFCAS